MAAPAGRRWRFRAVSEAALHQCMPYFMIVWLIQQELQERLLFDGQHCSQFAMGPS
jgi:hypothetical protein